MKNLFSLLQRGICRAMQAWLLLLPILGSACQPAPSPASFTPFPSPAISPTGTAIPRPTVTEMPGSLSKRGPWLVYKIAYPIEHTPYSEHKYFIVNQDGTGQGSLGDASGPGEIQASPFNHLVFFPGEIYLFESAQMDWALVHDDGRECWGGADCFYSSNSAYTGSNEKGLLAVMPLASETEDIPELLIYEMPGGKIRDRFPLLFKCPEQDEACDTGKIEWWSFEMDWSPDGRYLAFAAALENQENQSSDLYLYDSQTGDVLRLTNGPDSVAQIAWSPDGQWIIMGELHGSLYPYTTSLWVVSPANHEMRKLYSLEALYPPGVLREAGYPQSILGWLDDRRFIVYGGITMVNAFDLPVYGLLLVDIDTGKATMLVDDVVVAAELDREHETLAVHTYDLENGDQGTSLVSISDPRLRYMGTGELYPHWNDELKLFITDTPCENDPKGLRAFDYKGEWQCIYLSEPDRFPSPDGQWQVSIQSGTWLKANNKQPVQIIPGDATQVIWRLDSEGFFFIEQQALYYVSSTQVTPRMIDQDVNGDWLSYQWVGGD